MHVRHCVVVYCALVRTSTSCVAEPPPLLSKSQFQKFFMRSTAFCGALLALALIGSCADPVAPGPIAGTTVVVDNMLLAPVRVKINGVDAGIVSAASRREI